MSESSSGEARRVRIVCSLLPPAGTRLEGPVHVRLTVEDVSLLDSASTTVSEIDVIARTRDDLRKPFEIVAGLRAGRRYAIRGHVDRSGDGQVATGDLVTTAQHAVAGDRAVASIELPMVEVRPAD
ncbi:hypothetical protein ACGFIF_43215 [Kribbella sp. NPDC049174]|uniref:hypothetical protein n=1 Tax=Kribbella sp. NPDC049174 TaxID=3364112 RepID=UPI003715E166